MNERTRIERTFEMREIIAASSDDDLAKEIAFAEGFALNGWDAIKWKELLLAERAERARRQA